VDIDIPGGKIHTTDKSGPFLYAAYDAVLLSSYVDFLRTKGKARLLNRSQVTAKSGFPATVNTVDDVVTFERTLGSYSDPTIDPAGPTVPGGIVPPDGEDVDVELTSYRQPTLDYVKQDATVGVNVTILPVIGQKSSEVGVKVSVSDINGFTPAGTPIIEKREVNSKVTLAPGEPYVIGGLTRKANLSATGKVPVLGSIPVLGYLFGHETESASESQVIIVLTPAVTLNAESIIAMPAEAKTAKAIVDSEDFQEVPKTRFGFDQWLLDEDK
jgi:Flp pilus assembly secretin CpaC